MLLLVDLDGVVYRGRDPVPGVALVLAERAARGDLVVYVTNNSMYYRTDYVPRLAALGAPVASDRVVSSARATALHLVHHEPALHRVLVIGEPGLRRELADVGLEVIDAGERARLLAHAMAERSVNGPAFDEFEIAGRPDAVVVGLDQDVTYGKLAVATIAIRGGARFIATNRDPVLPIEHSFRPGAGSIVAAVEAATRVTPLSIGKPAPAILEEAARIVGARATDGIVIGDGLDTDVAAAHAVGARSVLMLTGVTSRARLDELPASDRPDEVAEDAAGLAAALDRLAAR
ncbi:MAG TPA: HAD-IIA family hydrolase [Candidatus Sulfomarinibacteraceae bacterium]|nr:HAD-IIA family hydrolase [Candidatus Sulfomarinibacteraceae bacterium]